MWTWVLLATHCIYTNKTMFTSYTPTNGGKLFMKNSSRSKVEGQGKVLSKLMSNKELNLNNVLHMLDIHKNLASGSLLIKNGFKLVFVSDNFVLIKNNMYIGKCYLSDGLLKMNIFTILPNILKNKISSSTCIIKSSTLWHHRLRYTNFTSIRK